MSTLTRPIANEAGPAWDVALLFPEQGHWSEVDYLALTNSTSRLVECSQGRVEILPMPKMSHQKIVQYLSNLLLHFVSPRGLGTVLFAPLRVRLPAGTFREPDVVFMFAQHVERMGEDYWEGADLVMEVVSEDNRQHDLVAKRNDYAEAGIPEYWIVDPAQERITVLRLADGRYEPHGEFARGDRAGSALLPGFEADVSAVFAAAAQSSCG